MKAKTEGRQEDNEDDRKLCHGVDDVIEHEDEDAKERDILEVGEEVEPGDADKKGSNRPLPALKSCIHYMK